jgi:hypothetical protein
MSSTSRHSARVLAALGTAVTLALAAAPAALAGSGSGSGGSGGGGSGGAVADFALSANYKAPSFFGRLVRGGLPTCALCTTSVEPRYPVTGFTIGWDSNSIDIASLGGFSGPIALEVGGLPAGVSSQTAPTVTVPRRGAVSTAFRLSAAAGASPGSFDAIVRATGGNRTHSVVLPVQVVEQLP